MLEAGSVVDEVVKAAREVLDVVQVILFGSRSDGSASEESDHDFLIVARSDLRPNERTDLVRLRLLHVREPMDIIVVTPEEFERLRCWTSSIVHEAAENGKLLYEAA
jgi:uncharacterized protein